MCVSVAPKLSVTCSNAVADGKRAHSPGSDSASAAERVHATAHIVFVCASVCAEAWTTSRRRRGLAQASACRARKTEPAQAGVCGKQAARSGSTQHNDLPPFCPRAQMRTQIGDPIFWLRQLEPGRARWVWFRSRPVLFTCEPVSVIYLLRANACRNAAQKPSAHMLSDICDRYVIDKVGDSLLFGCCFKIPLLTRHR